MGNIWFPTSPSFIRYNIFKTTCSCQQANMDYIHESFISVIKVNRYYMEHTVYHLKENSYNMLYNAILFRQVWISYLMNNSILPTEQIYHQVDELSPIITLKTLHIFTRLLLQHSNNIPYYHSNFLFMLQQASNRITTAYLYCH